MVIDAHQHLWRIGRNGQEWPTPDLAAIHRDFGLDDLQSAAEGVDGSVLVQSQPNDADTDWMLTLASGSPFIRGVVGWADLASAAAPERLERLAKQAKLKGIRPMLQGLPDDDWILSAEVQPALKCLIDLGLSLDALIFPRHLNAIDRLARTYPDLRIVVDHCAKPQIGRGQDSLWRDAMARLAENSNVCCKLSGLITEAAETLTFEAVRPYADHVLAVFGPDRLMWGSDWPVLNLRSTYAEWLGWTKIWVSAQTSSARKSILGGTARRFYQLT